MPQHTRQAKDVSTFGNAGTSKVTQTNWTRGFFVRLGHVQGHQLFDHTHGFPRNSLIGSPKGVRGLINLEGRLSRQNKSMIRRRMQIKHGLVGLATCGGSILSIAVVLMVVSPVISTTVLVISASLRFLLRRRSCVMKIQQSSGRSGLTFGVTDHDDDAGKKGRMVEANRGRERERCRS